MIEETTGDGADDEYDLYADLWPALSFFIDHLQTQWLESHVGRTGLRYEAIPVIMDLEGIAAEHRRGLFSDLQAMEREALRLWRRT